MKLIDWANYSIDRPNKRYIKVNVRVPLWLYDWYCKSATGYMMRKRK